MQEPVRQKLPRTRNSKTFSFRVADCHGYATVGEYEDGRPGEVFLKVAKQGSTLAGIMDAFAISVSHGLQYGVPLEAFVEMFTNMRFEPAGMTDDPDLRIATSLVDYIFRKLAVEYLPYEKRVEMGVLTVGERTQPTLPGVEEAITVNEPGLDVLPMDDRAPSALPPRPRRRRRPRRSRRGCGRARRCSATSAATSCSGPAAVTPARAAAPPAAAHDRTDPLTGLRGRAGQRVARSASMPSSRRRRLRAKRVGSRRWSLISVQLCCEPALLGHRRELRVVTGRDEVVHVGDHLVVEAVVGLEVVALHQAVAEHVLVDRGDDVELVGERAAAVTRPLGATGRSGARCWARSAGRR